MLGERDHDVGQSSSVQRARPAGGAEGGGDQQRLLLAAQLALSAGARGSTKASSRLPSTKRRLVR